MTHYIQPMCHSRRGDTRLGGAHFSNQLTMFKTTHTYVMPLSMTRKIVLLTMSATVAAGQPKLITRQVGGGA